MAMFAGPSIAGIPLPGVFASDDMVSLLVIGLAAGLMTGLCEELGWTGFVIPRLRLRYGILTTGLIVGMLWGAWHFPLFSGGDLSGALPDVSLTASTLILQPLDVTGMRVVTYDLILTAALWLLIAALAMTHGRQLPGPSLRPRMASTSYITRPGTGSQFDTLLPLVASAMLAGPAVGDPPLPRGGRSTGCPRRESHRQHGLRVHACGYRVLLLALHMGIGRRDVDCRGSGRMGQRRAAFPTTAPEANGVAAALLTGPSWSQRCCSVSL
jgi:hypothetical protein